VELIVFAPSIAMFVLHCHDVGLCFKFDGFMGWFVGCDFRWRWVCGDGFFEMEMEMGLRVKHRIGRGSRE
jgi:hypothetical protein